MLSPHLFLDESYQGLRLFVLTGLKPQEPDRTKPDFSKHLQE